MKKRQKSIKIRLIYGFVCIVLISVTILEIILISLVRQYYYDNLEEIMTNHIKMSANFYVRYFSNSSLEDNIIDNIDVFWRQTTAQVQIINSSGDLLMDSIGYMPDDSRMLTNDVKKALAGEKGRWIGAVPYDDIRVMAVSYPLMVNNEVIGVIRFISSLREVNNEIENISWLFISIGAAVVVIAIIVSIFVANSIIVPLEDITYVASKMAKGNFEIRSKKHCDDEIGNLSDTLNYMAEEIVKKDNLKNEFISSVSHELRTPLTSIKGWAATLNGGELDDSELLRDGLAIIEKESDRLTVMVEELLDFSRFTSSKMTLKLVDMDISTVIEYVKKHMTPMALRNNLNFYVEYEDDLPKVNIDADRIKQVFINILDNAFKFTPNDNDVMLKAWYEHGYVNVSIVDTGCGIEKDELPRVKEKFFKGKNSKSQHGIGLSICDEIVKLHGGVLDIDSKIDCGTTVTIRLPVVNTENLSRGQ